MRKSFKDFQQKTGANTTEQPTMNIRLVVKKDGFAIEQMVQYVNDSKQITGSTWVEIPTIYEG